MNTTRTKAAAQTAKTAGILISTILAVGLPTSTVRAQTLAGDWRLNEGAGSVASDSSANGNAGVLAASPLWIPGRSGAALRFDGAAFVRVPASPTLEPAAVTLEAWVRHLGYPGGPGQPVSYIAAKGGAFGCSSASYALYSRGTQSGVNFYVSNASGYILSPDSGPAVWDGNWHHLAGTFDGAIVRLFVDGVEAGTGTRAAGPIVYNQIPPHQFFIGTYAEPGVFACAYPFHGDIDGVRVWTRARPACELASDFEASKAKPAYTIVSTLAKAGNFSVYLSLLDKAGLTPLLAQQQQGKEFTVFAPNDAAFAALPKPDLDKIAASPDSARAYLLQTILVGRLALSRLAESTFPSPAVTNLNGKVIQSTELTCHPGGCNLDAFGGGHIRRADIEAGNGWIDESDQVLLRPIYVPPAELNLPIL